ncbi:MAG: hypothetical protein NTX97_13060 [Bacteroidetes bacterium]|nr:hypothetical protein [Bacteroidota bacterium]
MKKLILAFAILLATTAQTFAGPIITLSVEFGHRDASGLCIERGLCKITIGVSRNMTATINDNTGNLELTIIKSVSQNSVYQAQFINGIFEVPVAYSLPADVCAKLGVDRFTVKSGKYKVVETKTQYTIVFIK